MNRFNTFILLFFSGALSILVVFLYLNETKKKEPQIIVSPLKIEAYRLDRHPLPDADIYLNQRFIGRTDGTGYFSKNVSLVTAQAYTLRIEKDRDGYVYGPWETTFRVEEERKRRRVRKREEAASIPSLQGDSDILSELERAQLGRASQFEKYHFLAVIDGHMFYTIRVLGKDDRTIQDAAVIVNGKEEGRTDRSGTYIVKYSGDSSKSDDIQVFKEGEHIWMSSVTVEPDAVIDVRLNHMLLIDLYVYSEYYDVVRGVPRVDVYLGDRLMGQTDEEGAFSFTYVNENGVDGPLELAIQYPDPYLPKRQKRNFLIRSDLPRLTVKDFAYSRRNISPKVAVLPIVFADSSNYFLKRYAQDLKSSIEDNISSEGFFTLVSGAPVADMMRQFNIDFRKSVFSWKDIPIIKKEVDAVIVGRLAGEGNRFGVAVQGFDYRGEKIFDVTRSVSLREFQSLSEEIAQRFRNNFPVEGNVIAVGKNPSINLGTRQGLQKDDLFYGFFDYYDKNRKSYAKKRVFKVRITGVERNIASGELESVSEGYLLEAGIKVKRAVETSGRQKEIELTIEVSSDKKPLPEANVYLDDQWYGQTDASGVLSARVKSGMSIDFLVYKEGYIPGVLNVRVTDAADVLRFDLKRGKSSFRVSSDPEGALLFIDGEYRGTTPVLEQPLVVPYGFHLVELELKGYIKYRNYVNFSGSRVELTGNDRVVLFRDLLALAEKEYEERNITKTISLLLSIPDGHPDYRSAMELLGYIYLSDIKNYRMAIEFYGRSLQESNKAEENIFSYYNLGQAYYNEAESMFYTNNQYAQYNYLQAVNNFEYVKARKSRIPVQTRQRVNQDTLFYLAVCYQKLYYLALNREYLSKAYYSWIDYFDFFPNELSRDEYFRKQNRIAESYREEAERLYGAQ